jgi:hypothetical protein
MIGILSEALIVELFIRYFGTSLVSLSIAGALSVSSALLHKVVSLLILYGFNIVTLYLNIFNYLAKQVRMEGADPWVLVLVVLVAYVLAGIVSAYLGMVIGKRASSERGRTDLGFRSRMKAPDPDLLRTEGQRFSLALFLFHLVMIPAGLVLLQHLPLVRGAAVILLYSLVCIVVYGRSLRRLKKPVFWLQLMILTLLAAVFWNGVGSDGELFGTEGLLIGLEMNLRAVFVVIAFSSFSVELRNPRIRDYLFRRGFDRIYAGLGLSFAALPVMMDAMPGPRAFLRHPVHSFSLMVSHAREWLTVFEQQQGSAGDAPGT